MEQWETIISLQKSLSAKEKENTFLKTQIQISGSKNIEQVGSGKEWRKNVHKIFHYLWFVWNFKHFEDCMIVETLTLLYASLFHIMCILKTAW